MAETQRIWPPECLNIPARSSPKRSLRQVKQFVATYTSKVLQFDSDIKRAFDGIQGSLAASMGNARFLYGLPTSSFDWALLWSGSD
jgi:hypothetical protein